MTETLSDEQLLKRAVDGARNPNPQGNRQRVSAVMWQFAIGHEIALELCERFALDPFEEIPEGIVDAQYCEMTGAIQSQLDAAHRLFPEGQPVRYFPVQGDSGFHEAQIRSKPWVLGSGHVVVKITGKAGGVHVDHLRRIEAGQ